MLLYCDAQKKAIIVSCGGSGTTTLIQFLQKHINCNADNDIDTLKHCPFPPISFNSNLKVVYLISDPVESIGSLFRRSFQHASYEKLARFSGFRDKRKSLKDLDTYAEKKKDLFLMERHFKNWTKTHQVYETLIIKYEHLWENLPKILEFLNLPKELASEFPAKKPRNTKLNPRHKALLQEMYRSLITEIDLFPDIQTMPKKKLKMCVNHIIILPFFLYGNSKITLKKKRICVSLFMQKHYPRFHEKISSVKRKSIIKNF